MVSKRVAWLLVSIVMAGCSGRGRGNDDEAEAEPLRVSEKRVEAFALCRRAGEVDDPFELLPRATASGNPRGHPLGILTAGSATLEGQPTGP